MCICIIQNWVHIGECTGRCRCKIVSKANCGAHVCRQKRLSLIEPNESGPVLNVKQFGFPSSSMCNVPSKSRTQSIQWAVTTYDNVFTVLSLEFLRSAQTRMHSSKMRSLHLLTISHCIPCISGWGVGWGWVCPTPPWSCRPSPDADRLLACKPPWSCGPEKHAVQNITLLDRKTPVKILPCSKLCLAAVISSLGHLIHFWNKLSLYSLIL